MKRGVQGCLKASIIVKKCLEMLKGIQRHLPIDKWLSRGVNNVLDMGMSGDDWIYVKRCLKVSRDF